MSSSLSEKKSSDVEMGEANSALPTPAMHEGTPTFIAGFLSFKERLSRRSAEKDGGRIQPEVPAILSSPAMSTSAGGNKSPGDATPLAESAMVPVQVPEVSAQPSGSSTTPVPAPKEEKATELMPPPLDRKEIVLGLPASSAAPLTKSRKRTGAATETVKKKRCTAGAEGEPSGPLSQHRAKRLRIRDRAFDKGLAESREALKQAEATLKSTEAARAAELSQLEVRVSDLERNLGKSASALFKLKKEKKGKASEVSAQPSGSSTTPVPAPKEEKATELMPPPLDRKEIVLGLPASSAAPLTKSRKRTGAATETVKKRRCTAGAKGEPSGPLSQHRVKAALKSTEATRAAEISQLEVRVSDLERDLGKSASALFKLKKEKKSKASEVCRLQREIQN
ncbi:hypothetical protein F2Q69_00059684 [Brassica cretica]|uniref:Uncharacterized protein n=1 Tax=Brassica cretica TaxID=69181 RepID=A0A8S9RJT6_BRACR|nr:hypothetical protein F2Q69_00059684 [Brassica cretica]